MLLILNRERSIGLYPKPVELDCRQDHGIDVHEGNDDDEDKPKNFISMLRDDSESKSFYFGRREN